MGNEQRQAAPLNLRWTLSNALSALRIVLVAPMAYTLAQDMRVATAAICVLAVVTDVLDGHMARRRNEISDLGKILDPLADKVFVGVLALLMLGKGLLPAWAVIAVLGRDAVILLGGIYVERRTGQVLPSNYPGKIAVLVLSATMFAIILEAGEGVSGIMLWISMALLALSLVLYAARGIRIARGAESR